MPKHKGKGETARTDRRPELGLRSVRGRKLATPTSIGSGVTGCLGQWRTPPRQHIRPVQRCTQAVRRAVVQVCRARDGGREGSLATGNDVRNTENMGRRQDDSLSVINLNVS